MFLFVTNFSDLHSLNELNEDNFEHVEEGSDENDTLVEDERQELV